MAETIALGEGATAVTAYLSRPHGQLRGAVIVVHEVWGLVKHITDVADRLAAEGYLALAPDLVHLAGLNPDVSGELQRAMFNPDAEARSAAQPQLRALTSPLRSPEFAATALGALRECFDYLTAQEQVDGRIGVIGFCFGGTQAFSLAVAEPRLRGAVPFYGHADYDADQLRSIACPILAFYGEEDTRLMDGLAELTAAMGKAAVDFRPRVYPDCGHAFFNDSNVFAYNESAAGQAWAETLGFLAQTLRDPETPD